MSNGPLNGQERTHFTLDSVNLTSNAASACGAVAMNSYMAGTLKALNVNATGNRATVGDAGALCVVPLVPKVTGTLGQSVAITDHAGDLSLVAPGSPAPLGSPFTANWVLTPFPGCALSLVITSFTPVVAFQTTFVVQDVASGAALVQNLGAPTIGALPLEVFSTTDAGLNVTYVWVPISATPNREAGFVASWRNSCPTLGGGRVLSDSTSVLFSGGEVSGGLAALAGGALLVSADPGYARTRSVELNLERVRFADNTALSGEGGAVSAQSSVPLGVHGCDLRHNRALNGQGGGMSVVSAPIVSVTDTSFEHNEAGGGGGHGGGLAVAGAGATLSEVHFEANTAQARPAAALALARSPCLSCALVCVALTGQRRV